VQILPDRVRIRIVSEAQDDQQEQLLELTEVDVF